MEWQAVASGDMHLQGRSEAAVSAGSLLPAEHMAEGMGAIGAAARGDDEAGADTAGPVMGRDWGLGSAGSATTMMTLLCGYALWISMGLLVVGVCAGTDTDCFTPAALVLHSLGKRFNCGWRNAIRAGGHSC